MNGKDWFGLIFILILSYLVLNNSNQTQNIITTLGTQATALTGALQGRGVTNNSVKLSAGNNGGLGYASIG